MKKIFIGIAALVLMGGCTKTYTCQCTIAGIGDRTFTVNAKSSSDAGTDCAAGEKAGEVCTVSN